MQFSVIIPTFERTEDLSQVLNNLAPGAQTLSSDQYEVIVSDDGKQVRAEELIQQKFPWVKYVRGPQVGPAANRNTGAKIASGEWLVFTDDDCVLDANWLAAYALQAGGTA